MEKANLKQYIQRFGLLPPADWELFATHVQEDTPAAFFGGERLIQDLENIEERWTCGFHPEELEAYLRRLGLVLKEDKDAAWLREKYIPERKAILKGYEFYRVAMAGTG